MNFVRWVFYDTSGAVKYTGMQRGDFAHVPSEQVAAALGLTGCACLEWREPDAEIEAAFEPVDAEGNPRIVNVSVDVSGEAPQLVFTYEAIPEMESETEDMAAALALLGVEPEEGA
ncbi:MAG: hypothetical protein DBX40_04765 [Clostridiales bacterium]|jgi:hypothetical protein|nr:MAG: hypothetical protein DBX40_04765 [Clostridiales bacterium]